MVLDVAALHAAARRPRPWETGDAVFWTQPHVAARCLETHLDPHTDQATRRPATVRATVDWICSTLDLGKGARLLDIGCGPGLYCRQFARRGLLVTGVDFSVSSIAYARAHAPGVTFVHGDYLEMDYHGDFDVVTLIYGDFCVLPNPQRDRLLGLVRRALRPGGRFVLDVFTREYVERDGFGSGWRVHPEGGFWDPDPHLVLDQSLHYPGAHAALERYLVLTGDGRITRYHIWKHYYSLAGIRRVLRHAGYRVDGHWADLTGKTHHSGSHWIGLVARVP